MKRIGGDVRWFDFIIEHLIQEAEIQFGKPPSHLLLAELKPLDKAS